MAFVLATSWAGVPRKEVKFLLQTHQMSLLMNPAVYVTFLGCSVLFLIASALPMISPYLSEWGLRGDYTISGASSKPSHPLTTGASQTVVAPSSQRSSSSTASAFESIEDEDDYPASPRPIRATNAHGSSERPGLDSAASDPIMGVASAIRD